MRYQDGSPKIPAAAITVEDAEMLSRMFKRGQKIIVHLELKNEILKYSNSNNFIAEIKGSEKPNEILLIGGHIDSCYLFFFI